MAVAGRDLLPRGQGALRFSQGLLAAAEQEQDFSLAGLATGEVRQVLAGWSPPPRVHRLPDAVELGPQAASLHHAGHHRPHQRKRQHPNRQSEPEPAPTSEGSLHHEQGQETSNRDPCRFASDVPGDDRAGWRSRHDRVRDHRGAMVQLLIYKPREFMGARDDRGPWECDDAA